MPRAALILSLAVATGVSGLPAAALDPHLDPALVPSGCSACHRGHGRSRSPMLPAPQEQVCLACHGSRTRLDQQVLRGAVSASARPALLSAVLAQPFRHPLDEDAFSEREPGRVTCSSCHSPHRGLPEGRATPTPSGRPYLSPRNPSRREHELCETCHGHGGATTANPLDISRLLSPTNRSYHPVEAPAIDRSPSVVPVLSGREINCTDCHGNSDPAGPRGPHGSAVPFLLRSSYTAIDGSGESLATYALCYTCHEREGVLDSPRFPEHRLHVEEENASCSTCHNPHGSVGNRALLRIGEDAGRGALAASGRSGRLEYLSLGPGAGACYLTCHGADHGPESYGGMELPEGVSGPTGLEGSPGLAPGGGDPFPSLASPPPPPRRQPPSRPPPAPRP